MQNTLREIAEVIKKVKSATIFTHTRPDGDTLGSGVALYFALQQLGIQAEVCNEGDIPQKFFYLAGVEKIVKQPTFDAEAFIAVDCADEKRLGLLEELFIRKGGRKITVNIDHHISNTCYAKYNYVRETCANCMNMTQLFSLLGVTLNKEIANALYMGLLTDSGNFTHSDVDGEAFRTASSISDAGADIVTANYEMFKRQSKARAALYGATMSDIRYLLEDKLAIIVTTREMLESCGAAASDTEGFVDFPLTVDGVDVCIAKLEVQFRQFKISLRSKGRVNVNAVAQVFGGGGHILASGCMIYGDAEEVIDRLRYTVSQYM